MILSALSIFVCDLFLTWFIMIFDNGCIFGLYTENIIFQKEIIIEEYGVWLDNNHLSTYKKENFIFVKYIGDYEKSN